MFTKEDKNQKWYKNTYKDYIQAWFCLLFIMFIGACFIFKFIDTTDTWGAEEIDHNGQVVTISKDF
ncbi:hypothetical protein vBEfaS271_39 [Enterococcus phage vB_EfaS-271]|nr:hypothetical protein vBEfaS271_39 [Enterococcus phage vB_EfaS-271]